VNGQDYHFVSGGEFQKMADADEFAEWAEVHGHRYGTAIATVNQALERGTDFVFDIDYQGGQRMRARWPEHSVLCFILPPSIEELERRLRQRATDKEEAIQKRLAVAREELGHYPPPQSDALPYCSSHILSLPFVRVNLSLNG
jgi:guanylate kinase